MNGGIALLGLLGGASLLVRKSGSLRPSVSERREIRRRSGDALTAPTPQERMEAALDAMTLEVSGWRGRKGTVPAVGVEYFRHDPFELKMTGQSFIRAGQKWMERVIDELAIPPKRAKGVEMLARAFNRVRLPKDYVKWFDKNQKRWDLLRESFSWGPRTACDVGHFQVGPFRVHNTVCVTGAARDRLIRIIEGALTKATTGTGLPMFSGVLYGDIYIVGNIKRPNWAAWYVPSKDAIYLRARPKGSEEAASRTLIHELGHRYWRVHAATQPWASAWHAHHRRVGKGQAPLPDPGTELPFPVNGKTVTVGAPFYEVSAGRPVVYVYEVGTGKQLGMVNLTKLRRALNQFRYPSMYAATDPEEHFCQALSMRAMGTLTEPHLTPYEQILINPKRETP